MKNHLNIHIPNRCEASWEGMTPDKNGKFCSLCNKTVVDFSKMSVEEIKCYFSNQAGKSTCGFFYKSQLENDHTLYQESLLTKYRRINSGVKNKVYKAAALFVLGLMLSLSGCSSHNDDDDHVVGKMMPIPDSLIQKPVDSAKTH